jgi:hypothetical protein
VVRAPWWRPRCGECRHRLHPPHEPHTAKESRDVREVAIALPPLSTGYASSHGQPWQEGDSGRPRVVGAPWLGSNRGSELEAPAHFLPLERERVAISGLPLSAEAKSIAPLPCLLERDSRCTVTLVLHILQMAQLVGVSLRLIPTGNIRSDCCASGVTVQACKQQTLASRFSSDCDRYFCTFTLPRQIDFGNNPIPNLLPETTRKTKIYNNQSQRTGRMIAQAFYTAILRMNSFDVFSGTVERRP